jgi:hypothetical protein
MGKPSQINIATTALMRFIFNLAGLQTECYWTPSNWRNKEVSLLWRRRSVYMVVSALTITVWAETFVTQVCLS